MMAKYGMEPSLMLRLSVYYSPFRQVTQLQYRCHGNATCKYSSKRSIKNKNIPKTEVWRPSWKLIVSQRIKKSSTASVI